MIIGLLGLAFDSGNKGCEALGYGFLAILQDIASNRNDIFDVRIFEVCDIDKIYKTVEYKNLKLSSIFVPGIGSIKHLHDHKEAYGNCDIVFDFTAGDSFSDIYGMERFLRRTIVKILAIKSSKRFVLGSQTYGPYKTILAQKMASYVMKKSYRVFTRDNLSKEAVYSLSHIKAVQTIDVAFAMPYKKTKQSDMKIAGFNPSGLLWAGGYTGKNQFGLKTDYKDYCRKTIGLLFDNGYKVALVPHVLSRDFTQKDNDVVACNELHSEFPETILAPFFETPVEAKSYISGLNLFIGARMHATIAALSTGIPVLPFSYSRKFEGLFSSMNYSHIISGTILNTEDAIEKTRGFIDNVESIRDSMSKYQKAIQEGVQFITSETNKVLFE